MMICARTGLFAAFFPVDLLILPGTACTKFCGKKHDDFKSSTPLANLTYSLPCTHTIIQCWIVRSQFMEVGFKQWNLFANWCPTESWSSSLVVGEGLWQAQQEVSGFAGRHCAVVENHEDQLKAYILRIGKTLWQVWQLDHADTSSYLLHRALYKRIWCTGKKDVRAAL